ncbi:23S rRNA (uracil(1939)-C(5))-methyltransferase RlmD [Alloacidobacterium dinghuense]|uniref:23S rRNA (Uracil(1939)-C(5))-methyltransferase RlmD n=1 Tax=Alloacidobacterium dinghuense TaxID=2763107 RepID=A0A7G8BL14_9BACT|nr:23S rRNA (uracil(1939)-C(5))-methyltransferase RlmD [Alloacidobacterium dinghuense]QNI33234.1 23S rRNA (uracil(1939)-C(5))-methyltransferase RlmD [Alloacidobacterium dinghuense]
MRLEIEKCVYGGAGLARADGKAIFVPFTLPGEVVEAHITEDKGSYANAELDGVLDPSNERAAAPCDYFGQCGGCQYQHAAYAQQVDLKVNILRETLERARIASIPEIISVSAEPLAYRNRVRLHIQREPFALCYKKRASHSNLAVNRCPIAAPLLQRASAAATRIGSEFFQEFDEIEFFSNGDESELLLSLRTRHLVRNLPSALKEVCEDLRQELPALAGASVFSTSDAKHPDKHVAEWAAQALSYRVGDFAYSVSAGSFFQVNRFLVSQLVELVTAEFSGGLAWDLYAGVGLFAQALGRNFGKIVAVEAAPSSWNDLRRNLSSDAHKTVRSGTLEFLHRPQGGTPDLVVIDPPRTGLGGKVVSLLTKVRPQTIVYVSCDPSTLSRDLRALVESGYHLRTIHMVDLFPQTFHLESVTVLSLG